MPSDCSNMLFINSKKIGSALRQDLVFSELVPDDFPKDNRIYILNLINTLTGGEFEQFIKAFNIALLSEQKNNH